VPFSRLWPCSGRACKRVLHLVCPGTVFIDSRHRILRILHLHTFSQRATPPAVRPLAEAEANLLALAEHSKQKYLDIMSRLQKESLKSDTAHVDESVQSVDDHENTIDSVSDEDGQADADGDADASEQSGFLQLNYNPALQPAKGCLTKTRKPWATRPVSPPAVSVVPVVPMQYVVVPCGALSATSPKMCRRRPRGTALQTGAKNGACWAQALLPPKRC
jgi:hypothetical protein